MQIHTRHRSVLTRVDFPLYVLDGTTLNSTPASFAVGDVQISKDGGAFTDIGTLPTHEGSGFYSMQLTAAETGADRIVASIVDQTGPQDWLDTGLIVETGYSILTANPADYELANTWGAMLNTGMTGVAASGTDNSITLDGNAPAIDDTLNGAVIAIIGGVAKDQGNIITAYNGTTKVATVQDTWTTNPTGSSVYVVYSAVRG